MSAPLEYKGVPISEMTSDEISVAIVEMMGQMNSEQLDMVEAKIAEIISRRAKRREVA